MADAAENGSDQKESYVADVAEFIIDIVAEKVQKEHIKKDVCDSAVQKGISYKLPYIRSDRDEHELFRPWPQLFDGSGERVPVRGVGEGENDDIDSDNRVVGVRRSVRPDAGSYWQNHIKI